MKYLILSDIHGNLEALQAVLLEINSVRIDKYVILGDLVGYGANPNEVVNIIKEKSPIELIRGNHDKAAAGISDSSDFNYAARKAVFWTRANLSSENRNYIASLPQGPVEVDGLFDIIHGAPWDEDYYIFYSRHAFAAFRKSDKHLTLFGHTHIPIIWSFDEDNLEIESYIMEETDGKIYEFSLEKGKRYLINPGSVGQPRDMIPKASLAVFDTDDMKMVFFRIDYNIQNAQSKIRQAGLDEFLADRLATGR